MLLIYRYGQRREHEAKRSDAMRVYEEHWESLSKYMYSVIVDITSLLMISRVNALRQQVSVHCKWVHWLNGVKVFGEDCVQMSAARVTRSDLQRAPHRLVARLQVAELQTGIYSTKILLLEIESIMDWIKAAKDERDPSTRIPYCY